MSRVTISKKNTPFKLDAQAKPIWICQCGLSKNKPFCDGSHTRTLGEKNEETYFYTSFTQKRHNISHITSGKIEECRKRKSEIIYETEVNSIQRIANDSKLYETVSEIRAIGGSTMPRDHIDQWSDLYLLKNKNDFAATMRVTQARDGLLDVEDYYPEFLKIPRLRSVIGSASRLYKQDNSNCDRAEIFNFIVEVWKDQYRDGMRVDLINATLRMIPYYLRLGYQTVGHEFVHPRTKKQSVAMVYIAHIDNQCILTSRLSEFYKSFNSKSDEYNWVKDILGEYEQGSLADNKLKPNPT